VIANARALTGSDCAVTIEPNSESVSATILRSLPEGGFVMSRVQFVVSEVCLIAVA